MTRFNKPNSRAATMSPVVAEKLLGLTTHEGAQGFERDPRGELFMLGAGRFFGENSFYEKAHEGADRFRKLVHEVAAIDPAWLASFLKWLRSEANIRTAAIVGAVEYTRALQGIVRAGNGDELPLHESQTARAVVRSVLQRADEPGEMIAYFRSRYGRSIPIAVKRGIADAITGHGTDRKPLYSEYTLLKYDTASHGYRFGDVVDIVCPATLHPDVRGTKLGDLFEFAIARRHDRGDEDAFAMLSANRKIRTIAQREPAILLDPERLKTGGLTWEDALSIGGAKLDKAKLWEALIDADALGYMAIIRNLRNFDEAGISKAHAKKVVEMIADPARVASSRQLPYRFYSAFKAAPSLRWGQALEEALELSTANIPALPGRTLVLVDTSGSMSWSSVSDKSGVRPVEVAALFGVALARSAAKVDLHGFATSTFRHELAYGGSVLRQTTQLVDRVGEAGHGTDIAGAVRATYAGHDRVVVFTDMQTIGHRYHYGATSVGDSVPAHVPLYAWNLVGYEASMMPTGSGNRHEFGGFSDSAFSIMQTLEAGRDGKWPF